MRSIFTALLSPGLKIRENLSFTQSALGNLARNLSAQNGKHLAFQFHGQRSLRTRKEDAGQAASARHQNRILRAQHSRRIVPEFALRTDLHGTSPVTIVALLLSKSIALTASPPPSPPGTSPSARRPPASDAASLQERAPRRPPASPAALRPQSSPRASLPA
jgi:hypothetical protein